jgi:hypothetical protein
VSGDQTVANGSIQVPDPQEPITEVSLGTLRDLLAPLPGDLTFTNGFEFAHSWRGIYAEVAFEPAKDATVAVMAHEVWRALTERFFGYKGGEYTYAEHTSAHLSPYGESTEYDWTPLLAALRSAGDSGSPEARS